MVLGLQDNSAARLMRFPFKSLVMDTWYVVSLVIHLNWRWFLKNFLASSSLQQFQMKSSVYTRELRCLSLWQTTTEYLGK